MGQWGSFAVRSEDIGAVGQGGGAVGHGAGRRGSGAWRRGSGAWRRGSLASARVFGQHALKLKMLTQSLTRIVQRIMGSTGTEFSEEEHLGAVGQFCSEEEQWGSEEEQWGSDPWRRSSEEDEEDEEEQIGAVKGCEYPSIGQSD